MLSSRDGKVRPQIAHLFLNVAAMPSGRAPGLYHYLILRPHGQVLAVARSDRHRIRLV